MVYSVAGRLAQPLEERARTRSSSALLLFDGKRVVIGPAGATLGRSRQCDIVLGDTGISRQHAEIRPRGGSWVFTDLESTNGSTINGRPVQGPEVLKPGDEIALGGFAMQFELE
jgi:pSer/pThr/pTyr-binding forkhead associated (FHA) protein